MEFPEWPQIMQTIANLTSKGVMLVLGLVILSGLISPVLAHAQGGSCQARKIRVTDIFRPSSFLPIVDCGTDSNGDPVPLSLAVLPNVMIRLFGALASLVFYLFGFIVLFSGIQYTYGGIDGGSSITQAKRNLQDSVIGLVLVLGAYVIINTILVVLLGSEAKASSVLATDIQSFFTPI
jgi:hypothetical protein